MSTFVITISVTLAMLLIIGVQTSTSRILMVMLASFIILIGSGMLIPSVTSILIPGGPSRHTNGELIKDDQGNKLYTRFYMDSYQNTQGSLNSILYLCGSLLGASSLLLLYRFLSAGYSAFSHSSYFQKNKNTAEQGAAANP